MLDLFVSPFLTLKKVQFIYHLWIEPVGSLFSSIFFLNNLFSFWVWFKGGLENEFYDPGYLINDTASFLSVQWINTSFCKNVGAGAIWFHIEPTCVSFHITRRNTSSCVFIFPWCGVGFLHKRNQSSLIPFEFLG